MVDGNVNRMILDLQPEESCTLIQVIMPGVVISETIEQLNEEYEPRGLAFVEPSIGGDLSPILEIFIVLATNATTTIILGIIANALWDFIKKTRKKLTGKSIQLKSRKHNDSITFCVNIDNSTKISIGDIKITDSKDLEEIIKIIISNDHDLDNSQ